jgi:hypothetical protein
MNAAELAGRIPGGVRRRGDWYDALCPVAGHDDSTPSLSFRDGKNRIIFTCHKGCSAGVVAEAMAAKLGVRVTDFHFPKSARHESIETTYDYTDLEGLILFQEVRTRPKRFFVRRPDGRGDWINDILGIPAGVLFRGRDLKGKKVMCIVEGPKDAETLWKLDIPATTNAFGAGKWSDAHSATLVRAGVQEVNVLRDNDRAGEAHATQVRTSCLKAGLKVKAIELPDLPPLREKHGEDVTDWLNKGHTKNELMDVISRALPLLASPLEAAREPVPDVLRSGAHASPGSPAEQGRTRWEAARPAVEFLNTVEADVAWLVEPILAPGSITEIFSPRGLGKTHVAYALAVRVAREGRRVLLLDRDNSRRELKRRLRAWGTATTPTFKVMTRDEVPPLTDKHAWAAFPFREYDLVIIDSLDASTEGVGEKDSAKPSRAIAPILDIAYRANGPAILLLGNVIKSGEHSRGSGVIEDRADIVFEVRDATDFVPTGAQDWWLELPLAGVGAWGQRASRRKQRDTYRLAFVPTKFRVGPEPRPFIYEIDLSGAEWVLRKVTDQIVHVMTEAAAGAKQAHAGRIQAAAGDLALEILVRAGAGKPMRSGEAEDFLQVRGLPRMEARRLLADGGRFGWRLETSANLRGRPRVLLPLRKASTEAQSAENTAEIPKSQSPHLMRAERVTISADRMNTGRHESETRQATSAAAIREASPFPPVASDTSQKPMEQSEYLAAVRTTRRSRYAHPWPDSLPGLGPKTVAPYEPCEHCDEGTWARYGGRAICLGCARRRDV